MSQKNLIFDVMEILDLPVIFRKNQVKICKLFYENMNLNKTLDAGMPLRSQNPNDDLMHDYSFGENCYFIDSEI